MIHDHIDHHTMTGHTPHGGVMTVIEYEGIPSDQAYYHWAHKEFVPDFYYEESLKKPHDIHTNPNFRGDPVDRKSVVMGQSVSVRVALGGGGTIKKKNKQR